MRVRDGRPGDHIGRQRSAVERMTRLGDVMAACTLLVITLPLMLIVALAIKWESPGPILDSHTCIRAGGRRFQIRISGAAQDPSSTPSGRDPNAHWSIPLVHPHRRTAAAHQRAAGRDTPDRSLAITILAQLAALFGSHAHAEPFMARHHKTDTEANESRRMHKPVTLTELMYNPAARRHWMLYNAVSCAPFERAVELARAAEMFVAGSLQKPCHRPRPMQRNASRSRRTHPERRRRVCLRALWRLARRRQRRTDLPFPRISAIGCSHGWREAPKTSNLQSSSASRRSRSRD